MKQPNISYIEEVIQGGGTKDAFALIEEELLKHPNHPDLHYYKGVCVSSFDNFEDALDIFKKSMQLDPGNTVKCNNAISAVYCKSANIFFHENKFDISNTLFEKALTFNSKSNGALLGIGNILFKNKDYKSAKDFFKRSLSFNNNHTLSYYMLASCQYKLMDYLNAEINYLEAIRISPRLLNSYIWISNMYIDMNEQEKALIYLRKAEMIKSDDISLKMLICGVMINLEMFDDVIKLLETNYLTDLNKPSFYYSTRSFIRDINVINFQDNYLNKPFNYIHFNNSFTNDTEFKTISNKISEISLPSTPLANEPLSSEFFNFKKDSIVHKYFSNYLSDFVDNYSNNDLFFSNFNYDLDFKMGIFKSKNLSNITELTTGYAKAKALFFFTNNKSDGFKSLELEFSYEQLKSSSYFNDSFIKKITIDENCLIFFPGFINYKIINKNNNDLVFCSIEFSDI